MHHEIERKFLVKKMPNLSGIEKVSQERYFIQRGDLVEEGLKRAGSVYQYERKFTLSPDEKRREKTLVSKEEYESFKSRGSDIIERDSYRLPEYDKLVMSIKIYKGRYQGLVLAEVEFDSLEEMEEFEPFDWMGVEATHSTLGKDAKLVDLDREHFEKVMKELEDKFSFTGEDNQ